MVSNGSEKAKLLPMKRETSKSIFTLLPDNIIQIECKPDTVMDLEDGRLSTKIVGELTNGQTLPMLCDLTNVIKMSRDCREHFAGAEHARVFSKCALIIKSPISRIIGNFFLGANKPIRPTRLFNDREKGLLWLKEIE
jgi:hypothetical protein